MLTFLTGFSVCKYQKSLRKGISLLYFSLSLLVISALLLCFRLSILYRRLSNYLAMK